MFKVKLVINQNMLKFKLTVNLRWVAVFLFVLLAGSLLLAMISALISCQPAQEDLQQYRITVTFTDGTPQTTTTVTAKSYTDPTEIYMIGGVPTAFYEGVEFRFVKKVYLLDRRDRRIDSTVSMSYDNQIH
ncbi:hypothetical protein GCM10028806_33260 [Spirosoma terrae]|uniref:Uncharacterized protein n=1 Tax=Spirosoma terrae TaxID=1968276 RepID=A0A6L9L938_9BACT|nr:hypothetical protein [Spirosoma terrae]NDU95641.1 hypothetical protein [Spirosoma terrae]